MPVLEVERSTLDPQLEFYLYGALNTLRPVLDRMIQNGKGTVIVTAEGGSINSGPPDADAAVIVREYWSLLREPDTAGRHYAAHRAV